MQRLTFWVRDARKIGTECLLDAIRAASLDCSAKHQVRPT